MLPPPRNSPSAVGSWEDAMSGHDDVSGISIPASPCANRGSDPDSARKRKTLKNLDIIPTCFLNWWVLGF